MGFFDRLAGRKSEPAPSNPGPTESAGSPPAAKGVKAQLDAARAKLEARDLPGALAIYEEILAGAAGDRADVLVAISGDLGSNGHIAQIIELVAPRYDAERHGPATGINLIQAYLAMREAEAAQHVLDILFALNRPELEEKLHGYSNAIAEIIANPGKPAAPAGVPGAPGAASIGLVSITKPIWFYGLEPMATRLLPPKEGRLRRIAFAQLATPGYEEPKDAAKNTDDELGRLSRSIPLWFAETFYFSPLYSPSAAVGIQNLPEGANRYVVFPTEWTPEHLRQLVETTEDGVDYIVTGALRATGGDYEIVLRVWEVRGFRERKVFTARWVPATVETALSELHGQLRMYMEWSPASAAFAYTIPVRPRAWLDTLGASLGLFLLEKGVLAPSQIAPAAGDLAHTAKLATGSEAASLAFLTLAARAERLGVATLPADVALARSPLVNEARALG